MKWLNFLHFYQPADQQFDVLEAVVKQSYLPVFKQVNELTDARFTANISGSLLELFDKYNYHELLELIKKVYHAGKMELTGSCKYHALAPLIPAAELQRQIELNNETLRKYIDPNIKPLGFFPPEMAYDAASNKLLKDMGFKWIIVDEIAYAGGKSLPDTSKIYETSDGSLRVFFRDRRVSNLIMAAVARTQATLNDALKTELATNSYLVTGMDGETFGHHRPGLEDILYKIIRKDIYNSECISAFLATDARQLPTDRVDLTSSTWASSAQDIEKGIQFASWKDPENIIHTNQWELLNLVLEQVTKLKNTCPKYEEIRHKMDIALASDHFWWACAKPWWSVEMVEDGAFKLLTILRGLPNIDKTLLDKARSCYETIVSTAFDWQRTGKIREMNWHRHEVQRVPFKERTLEKGGNEAAVYHAFIDMLKTQERLAVKSREYEKAVLWRDALYKIDHKLDIFEAVNAIDLLRLEIGNGEVEKMLDKYTEKFRKIRGGQPEQRD